MIPSLLACAISGAERLSIETDFARYDPGQPVQMHLSGPEAPEARIRIRYYHLGKQVGSDWVQPWSSPMQTTWQPPESGGHGYLVVAELSTSHGDTLAKASCGIDVTAYWTDYPRYGYVSRFDPALAASAGTIVARLNRFHINGLQFYDWQWKHHRPLSPAATWPDIAKRETSGATVRAFIAAAHKRHVACMAYNLGFGAVDGFEQDGISSDWELYYDRARTKPYALTMPPGWATQKLALFDPGNREWQSAIFPREKEAVDHFGFDGWHMDQLGDLGEIYSAGGAPVDLKSRFPSLLEGAKAAVPGKLIFNNVGGYGLEETLKSPTDAMYLEAWHWMGQRTYGELHRTIEHMRSGGKAAILAAYMNYERAKEFEGKSPGGFNLPGVLLADATIFASGGFHLELGDDLRMLCNEYFPNHNLEPTTPLLDSLVSYYDFVVAYEEVLSSRNVAPTSSPAAVSGLDSSAVWTFARQCGNRTIIHLLNIEKPEETEWRDPYGRFTKPKPLHNVHVSLSGAWKSAFVATPDDGLGQPQTVPIEHGEIVVPQLDYWTMIVLERA